MPYVLYPERQDQLDLTINTLSENGIRYRVEKEYKHDPLNPFVAQIKNFAVEIYSDYNTFCFIKHLIGKKLDEIVHLEKCLQEPTQTEVINVPQFQYEEVTQ